MDGNTVWILVSTALVLLMVPGLALFYGGMVRSKNVLNMLSMNMYCLGVIPIVWAVLGFSIAVGAGGPDSTVFGFLGFDNFWMNGIADTFGDVTDGTMAGWAFGTTFAVITPALISGAVADRMKFSAWMVFVPVWSLLVYSPVVFWVYGGETAGWILDLPAHDFAGGTAIHINAGVAALAMVLVLGKRKGWPERSWPPHNLPPVVLGTGILWFGWFGFNSGLGGPDAGQALTNTFLAAAAGLMGWMIIEVITGGKPTTLGMCSGVVSGLVAITPAAGFVGTMSSIVFGLAAGVICFFAIQLKEKLGYDDSLDVVGIHMVGGIVGGLLIGFFASDDAFSGEFEEASAQLLFNPVSYTHLTLPTTPYV